MEVMNRFKRLDLVDRGSKVLWTEILNIVQEVFTKTIPKKDKYKKTKWLSEEVLQIDEKKREVKGKGDREKYTHLNPEFQRITKRDKEVF